jgi:hypothetical protein
MFKIMAMICFLGVGNLQQNLCFNANIPHEFKTMPECMQYVKMTINRLDADFKIPKNKEKWSAKYAF